MNIKQINTFDVTNGLGIRVSMFVSGCNFHCEGCFNPTLHDFNCGAEYNSKMEKIILEKLEHPDYKGLSILGGDPMWQDEDGLKQLVDLCSKVHSMGKDIWLWTGFTWEEIHNPEDKNSQTFMRIVLSENVDYLVDGRFELANRDITLAWKGSSNQRVIDVKKTLENKELVIL